MTGEEAVIKYIKHRVGLEQYTEASAKHGRYMLRAWMRRVRDWREPTPDEIVEWVMVPPSADGKHGREAILRAFYKHARRHRWIDVDVLEFIPTVPGSAKRPNPIPQSDVIRALSRATPPMYRAIILGRYAGLRASEIAGVHRDHLEDEQLYVLGKGRKERWVPAHPEVARVLSGAGEGWVFPARVGTGHASGQSMSDRLSRALPGEWTAHSLRHAFATEAYEACGDLAVVAKLLGHASTKTTERYVLVRDERTKAAVAALRLAS